MRKFLVVGTVVMTLLIIAGIFLKPKNEMPIFPGYQIHPIARMPLVQDDPFAAMAYGGTPTEQRGPEFRKWMSNGIKIITNGGTGSGTIVYHDTETNWAYIQSCGHLWDGNMSANEGETRKVTCQIMAWYHNETKLDKPKTYNAEVLYYSNRKGQDVSLLRFKPDWSPHYLPLAPDEYELVEGSRLHSVGCDGSREVAHYDVKYIGRRDRGNGDQDVVTTENSPRPGRSGGGLCTDDFFVAVCWGTSSYSGKGNGFFTPLETVKKHNALNGYGWLNDVGYGIARLIPIIDRNNPQQKYPNDYIPLPKR